MKQLALNLINYQQDVTLDKDCQILYYKGQESLEEELDTFINKMYYEDEISLDIETLSKDNLEDIKSKKKKKGSNKALSIFSGDIRCIQICLRSTLEVLIFDLGENIPERRKFLHEKLEETGFLKALKDCLKNPNQKVIGHNIKFDFNFLMYKLNIKEFRGVLDTLIMSQLLYGGLQMYSHSLKQCLERELKESIDKKEQASDWGMSLTKNQLIYAAKDTKTLFALKDVLMEKIKKENITSVLDYEMKALPAFCQMEVYGMPADINKIDEAIFQYEKGLYELTEPFRKTFPNTSLTTDPKKLKDILNKGLNINLESTSDDYLYVYTNIPEIKALSLARTIKRILDYLKGMKNSYVHGHIRGQYKQVASSGFGRTSCGKGDKESSVKAVNLQNPQNDGNLDKEIKKIPAPTIRECFRVTSGRKLIICDLPQAHDRIAAQVSQDKTLLKGYNDNLDNHSYTAHELAKIKGYDGSVWTPENIHHWAKVDKSHPNHAEALKTRNVSKNAHYGSLNGQGKRRLQQTAYIGGIDMTLEQAGQFIEAWNKRYRQLAKFKNYLFKFANNKRLLEQFTYTTKAGKELHYIKFRNTNKCLSDRFAYILKDYNKYQDDYTAKPSDVCAFTWMSTEADVMKYAMGVVVEEFWKHPEWEAHLCNLQHDELNCECKEEYAVEVATCVDNAMQAGMKLFISSIPVTEGDPPEEMIGDSWADK